MSVRPIAHLTRRGMRPRTTRRMAWSGPAGGRWRLILGFTRWAGPGGWGGKAVGGGRVVWVLPRGGGREGWEGRGKLAADPGGKWARRRTRPRPADANASGVMPMVLPMRPVSTSIRHDSRAEAAATPML